MTTITTARQSLLRPAENTTAKLKMGLMGFQGSGKTYTMTSVAIGLVKMMRELGLPEGDKPIAFMDTEKGSDWVRPRIEKNSIKLVTAKTRAFSDLLDIIDEAEQTASILLVDSATHIWREFVASYLRAKKRTALRFDDWNYLKGEDGWQRFTDKFINSNLHFIFAGRAGYEYDFNTDEETGKKQLEKTGIKMKAEGETGYEPDLLVLMERVMDMATKTDQHIAHVIKDRSTFLDGKEFPDPTFETFLPHIKCLNLGGKQLGIDTTRSSESGIPADARDYKPVQRRIAVDEIQTLLVLHIPGQAAADKKRKIELVHKHFNNASWTEIEEVMPLFDLRVGFDSLYRELEGKPSRYAPAVQSIQAPLSASVAINDSLPEHSAPPPVVVPDILTPQAAVVDTTTTEEGDIPKFLRRVASVPNTGKKQPSTKDQLLLDIPRLDSVQLCLQWGLEKADEFGTLAKKDQDTVRNALIAQQAKLLNGTGETHA